LALPAPLLSLASHGSSRVYDPTTSHPCVHSGTLASDSRVRRPTAPIGGSGTLSTKMTKGPESAHYVVAGAKPWNRRVFDEVIRAYPGAWSYVGSKDELAPAIEATSPRYAFFLHWSWKVPPKVLEATECVCFHMTDVPYGRGGTPLQNLIVRGHERTMLTAL